jgi:hypothetical protein
VKSLALEQPAADASMEIRLGEVLQNALSLATRQLRGEK